jgi:hypothetical protein
MQSLLIVVAVDEVRDVKTKILKVLVVSGTNLLLLYRSKEALAVTVIVGTARPTNAWHRSVIPQHAQVFSVRVLRAAI